MNFTNPFVLSVDEYNRDIDIFKHYTEDAAKYLSIETGDDYNVCLQFVKETIKQKDTELGIKDPIVNYLDKEENGDRVQKKCRLSTYLGSSIRQNQIISPTLTTYTNPAEKKSILVDFVDTNIKKRGIAKKAMFAAEMANDTFTMAVKDNEQKNVKISNNSLSGAHVSSSTPLFNKTAHSTLTSGCRSTSGYGNANNEKMLSGNRHYYSPTIVRNNIISIINNTDYKQLEIIINRYNLYIPSSKDIMDCIKYSAKLYWRSRIEYKKLESFVIRLNKLERAAFLYTGDLYSLAKYNDSIVRNFITRLSSKIDIPHNDPEAIFKIAPEDYVNLAIQLCPDITKGKSLKKDLKGTDGYAVVAATTLNIMQTMIDYSDFIHTFFTTKNVPASVGYFPDSIRRSALTSDTDSTIFTVQDWVLWFFGDMCMGDKGNAIAATMIFLATQAITHILAIMSANFGVEKSRLFQIAMKNEYKFDVFIPTQVAKHYYAITSCQEGNLFSKHKTQIKGVHLKSSNAPKVIMAKAKSMMEEIMYTINDGKKISILKYLKEIADIERSIISSLKSGSPEYFRMGQIKSQDSYKKKAHESPYAYYLMWNEVFGPKYGIIPEPPFTVIKVSTSLDSPVALNNWLSGIEDKELASRMQSWLVKNNRRNFNTILIPYQIIESRGIPIELFSAIGVRRIVIDICKVFYIILESLGLYILNDNATKIVSDEY